MPQSVGLVRRGGGGVHVFSVSASVCWTCASGGGGVHVFSVSASVCWTCASGGGGCSCVLCECLSLLDLCVGGGVVHVFSVSASVC